MFDDPCDSIPDNVWRYLWAQRMMDRVRSEFEHRAIRFAVGSTFGKLIDSLNVTLRSKDDPCDEWRVPRYTVHVDEYHSGGLLKSDNPPLFHFDRGEEILPAGSKMALVIAAARRLGATPLGFGLYSLPGYPELTTNQLLQIASEK